MKICKQLASAKADSGLEFVLSNARPDRLGDIIEPAGWELDDFKANPVALFNHRSGEPIGRWENVRVENGALRGTLAFAKPGIPRIDELRALTEQGILRAVSVGFQPIEHETFKTSGGETGIHFKRQHLLETSLVSIPANPDALAIAKSLNLSADVRELVFGKHATESHDARQRLIGKQAATPLVGKSNMSTMQQRIEDAQKRLNTLKDQLLEHLKTVDDNNVTDEFLDSRAELNKQIALAQKSLDSLKESEAIMARSSEIVVQRASGDSAMITIDNSSRSSAMTVPAMPLRSPPIKTGERVLRSLVSLLASKGSRGSDGAQLTPLQVMAERYGEDGKVEDKSAMILRALTRPEGLHHSAVMMVQRGASIPADMTTSGWASQLVATELQAFMELLIPASVYPGLSARGMAIPFGRSGIISIPYRVATPTIAGSFVGEGSPIPVRQGAFATTPLGIKKMAVISVFTNEIHQHSTPAIEGLVRNAIQEDTSAALDTVLLDATPASAIRPPGLRDGVGVTAATAGGGFTALVTDLKNLVGAIVNTSKGNLRSLVWIMNPMEALSISLTQNASGDFPFAAEINQGRFQGFPVLISSTVTAKMVFLVDAADFVTVQGDAPRFDVSDQTTLHMEDTTPLAIGTAGAPATVAAPTRSMFQTNCVALRMIMDVNWVMRRTGMVAWTQTVTW